jgi:kinetochore protein Mis13/DSN1
MRRLRSERDALENLLKRPRTITPSITSRLESDILGPEQNAILERLQADQNKDHDVRLRAIFDNLEPTIDQFADQIHRVAQYRDAGESVASRILSIAAEKLAAREDSSRRRAQAGTERSPRRDLDSVLRGLSRTEPYQ